MMLSKLRIQAMKLVKSTSKKSPVSSRSIKTITKKMAMQSKSKKNRMTKWNKSKSKRRFQWDHSMLAESMRTITFEMAIKWEIDGKNWWIARSKSINFEDCQRIRMSTVWLCFEMERWFKRAHANSYGRRSISMRSMRETFHIFAEPPKSYADAQRRFFIPLLQLFPSVFAKETS